MSPQTVNTLTVRNPSLEAETSGSRKSKAMAGAYSSTYSKLQAQGQLLHPSMQLAMADAAAPHSQELLSSGETQLTCRTSCTFLSIVVPVSLRKAVLSLLRLPFTMVSSVCHCTNFLPHFVSAFLFQVGRAAVTIVKLPAFAEAERAAAEADHRAFFKHTRVLGGTSLGRPYRGPSADAVSTMQSTLLEGPPALQGKKLRLGKKVIPANLYW